MNPDRSRPEQERSTDQLPKARRKFNAELKKTEYNVILLRSNFASLIIALGTSGESPLSMSRELAVAAENAAKRAKEQKDNATAENFLTFAQTYKEKAEELEQTEK